MVRAGRSRVGGFAGDDAERAAVHRGNHRQDRDAVERGEVGQFRAQEDALGNQRTHAGSDQQAGRTAAAVRRNTAPAGRLQHCIGVDPQETVWGGGAKAKITLIYSAIIRIPQLQQRFLRHRAGLKPIDRRLSPLPGL